MSDSVPVKVLPVASWRHTVILTLIFLVIAAAGAYSRARTGQTPSAAGRAGSHLYLGLIASELGLMYYVWRGTERRLDNPLATFFGTRSVTPAALLRDVLIAAALWGTWMAIELGLSRLFPSPSGAPRGFLPHGLFDQSLWILLSLVAGAAEELVFRGYFMRQVRALTGSAVAALLLQAVFFGIVHGYEGVGACVRITVFGVLFGLVALWQRNLRACALAHAWTDIAAGLLHLG